MRVPELSTSNASDAERGEVKPEKVGVARKRRKKKVYTGRIRACWKVDLKYLMHRPNHRYGQELYLCVTDRYRVVMLEKPVVPPTDYVPDGNAVKPPIDYAKHPFKRVCRLPIPGAVLTVREFLSWVRTPCYMYYPCTCYCTHYGAIHSFGYPCPSDACRDAAECGKSACLSSEEISCTPVPLWAGVVRLMYTKVKGVYYTFRYIVTVGTSAAYVAPLPPPKSLAYLLDYAALKGMIDRRVYRYILDKYGGRVPNLLDLLTGGVYIDQSYVFPDGVPSTVRVDMKYVFAEFKPRVAAFSYYLIGKNRAHAVLLVWLDSNAKAYAVAKAAWEMKRELYNTLVKTFRPDLVRKVEEVFVNDVPVEPNIHQLDFEGIGGEDWLDDSDGF
ncbi:MAG: hypothetical protein QW067_11190 [Thermofilaceae archaeon]